MAIGDLIQTLAADPTYGTTDPNGIKQRQLMANALMKAGASTEPVRSPWQGVARLAQGLLGGYESGSNQYDLTEGRKSAADLWKQYPGSSSASTPAPSQAMTTADATGGAMAPDDLMPIYKKAEAETGIPASVLMAQHKQESGFDPSATGKAGEIGIGQILPSTARDPGFGVAPVDPATLRDPETNIMFSARYLAGRAKALGQKDWSNPGAALAAYNGGGDPNYVANVSRYLPNGGTQVASADPSFAPQSNQPDFSGAPMPPPRPDDVGMPNSVRPVANFTNAPVADATDATDGEDKPAPAQVAQAAPAAAPKVNPTVEWATKVLAHPFASPQQQQIAGAILKDAMTQKEKYGDPYTDAQGNLVQRGPNNEIKMLRAAKDAQDRTPSSVQEYEYAKSHGFNGSFQDWKQQGGSNGGSPATVQEYNFYADQVRKGGQEPLSFLDYQKQKAARFANFDQNGDAQLISSLAARAMAGDKTWKTGLAKDPGLIRAVETEVAKGGDPNEIAQRILQAQANQVGRTQEQRTLGSASASNTLYGNAAASTIDTALQASREVARTGWMPINKIMQMGEKASSDPKLAAFVAANNTLVNDYAKATTPVGTPTDSQRHHAMEMLNTAQSPEVYESVVRMMHREIANTHRAIHDTKRDLQSGKGGELPPLQTPPLGPDQPGSQSTGVFDAIKNLFTPKNPGKTSTGVQWHIEGQ